MQNKKQRIKDLVSVNIFLKEDIIADILEKLDSLSDIQIDGLLSILEDAGKKQDDIILNIVSKDPDFPSKLNNFVKSESNISRKSEEKKAISLEADYLKSLEEKLSKIG